MLERRVALAAIDRAVGDAALERPWLTTSVLTAAVRALGSAGHISLIPEVLNRAATHELGGRALPGRQRVYNEAARMLARDTRSGVGGGRVERVLGILERMRADRVAPSSYTLQHVFAAARREPSNEPAQLLKILQEQMRAGMRPNRASFDALIEACAPAAWASTAGRQLDRLPLLLIKTCEICQVTPSGQTVRALLRLVHTPSALTVVEPLVAKLPFAPQRALRDDALVAARARVHAAQTADAALVTLRMRAIGFVTSDPNLATARKPKAATGDVERRIDTADGNAYTRAEFIEEYARFWGLESVGATPGGTRAATAGSLPVAQWLESLRREEGRTAASGAADEGGGSAADDAALVGAASDLILESRMAAHLERIREIMESNVDVVRGLARSIAEQDQEQRQQVEEAEED
ncbi:hypothetical protein Ctob_004373 [Chrysochromulina tobinii]|uniref:Uncharacterized protein n=1 Tax=Chrysochromulina tobinii TaxID=1460289 RepID=A0A0M0JJA0_9EUKA|nr:hypothetical protein Ctob_006031 [Chrysochromulina tobinii]KOO26654.1 hypothetical protein Ctob_004373 [Chrysochromulina tobinii]|eukprot:KOO24898.1 hypothetical protein Ctob_006031 [Chrysochromulina sp. CCMP291]